MTTSLAHGSCLVGRRSWLTSITPGIQIGPPPHQPRRQHLPLAMSHLRGRSKPSGFRPRRSRRPASPTTRCRRDSCSAIGSSGNCSSWASARIVRRISSAPIPRDFRRSRRLKSTRSVEICGWRVPPPSRALERCTSCSLSPVVCCIVPDCRRHGAGLARRSCRHGCRRRTGSRFRRQAAVRPASWRDGVRTRHPARCVGTGERCRRSRRGNCLRCASRWRLAHRPSSGNRDAAGRAAYFLSIVSNGSAGVLRS